MKVILRFRQSYIIHNNIFVQMSYQYFFIMVRCQQQ